MKIAIITISIIAVISAFAITFANGQEELNGRLIVDFEQETAEYTESHSFGVQTTVTVPENECNRCLRDNNPSECLIKCDMVMMVY